MGWITITSGSSSTGNGSVGYSVAANTNTTSRSGTLTIAGQTFTVNQAGAACTYSISPTSTSAGSTGGTGSVTVTAGSDCAWSTASNAGWMVIIKMRLLLVVLSVLILLLLAGCSHLQSGVVTQASPKPTKTIEPAKVVEPPKIDESLINKIARNWDDYVLLWRSRPRLAATIAVVLVVVGLLSQAAIVLAIWKVVKGSKSAF